MLRFFPAEPYAGVVNSGTIYRVKEKLFRAEAEH
jgi:hypothetical protein